MSNRARTGRLVVLEGPDGVGKTTLARALAGRLAATGVPTEYVSFPGEQEGTIGHLVYRLHHDARALGVVGVTSASLQTLHVAAHLDAIERRILPSLREGRWVVLDRYWWSTWVYGRVSGVDSELLDGLIQVELQAWKGLLPTIVFLVDREPSAVERSMHRNLRVQYGLLAHRERISYLVRSIPNSDSLDIVIERVWNELSGVMPFPASDMAYSHNPVLVTDSCEPSIPVLERERPCGPSVLRPAQPTKVYDTLWEFAAERQEVFFRKLEGIPPPWTNDPILMRHKFTNAYRASDRVSQYLIRNVAYSGEQTGTELFFRIMLFKLFNRIETWELLERNLGPLRYSDYRFSEYDRVLSDAMNRGIRIYSAAYIMPSGEREFGYRRKHRNNLRLLERMLEDQVPEALAQVPTMRHAFDVLRSYPTMGDFLAFQYAIDLNYSNLTNFSEMEFVVPGPGARDGIQKCFSSLGGLSEADMIRLLAERQEAEFERLGLRFRSLWGRRLQLIDCQNLLCEVSKYARLRHPDVIGKMGRTRIKQIYHPSAQPVVYWYPPKWGINDYVGQMGRD